MSKQGILYGNPENFRTQRALVAARYGQTKVTVTEYVPPVQKFPFADTSTPCYDDGTARLFGSTAISWHVGGAALRGAVERHAELLQWTGWAERALSPAVLCATLPALSLAPADKGDAAKHELSRLLQLLDAFLAERTFLVGERVSHADLAVAFALAPAYQNILDEAARETSVNVTRWFNTIVNQPEAKEVIGQFSLCDKPAQFDGKKFKEAQSRLQPAAATSAKGDAPAANKPKEGKKEKKAAEKKKDEAADDDAEDASSDALALEPKAKDPFAELAKGTFVMDDWKRTYSNEDTIPTALPYFWKNFDADNYSVWYCEYKFPKELSLVFMSCNLISGMFQRLDRMRKYAFGSMILFGADNDSTISGVWIWRGHDLAFTLSPDCQIDYESYEWSKLDAKAPETKTLIDEYFAWEGGFDGKKFNQGKIFK